MARQYDPALVALLREKQVTQQESGVTTLIKPVPDDARPHVLDPRVLEIAKQKKKLHEKITFAPKYSLWAQRYRPDKISYDLTQRKIYQNETLIPIQNDHYIDAFFYEADLKAQDRAVIIFLHGGGFTAGDHTLYENAMKLIAEQSGALVVFPEYRLAPETPFPGGLTDAWGTIRWVCEHAQELRISGDKIMVAGDSVGGNLAAGCGILDDENIIRSLFLLYPAVDSTPLDKLSAYSWSYDLYPVVEEHREYAINRIDRIKNSGGFEQYYLQGRTGYRDPLVSAVYYDNLKKFPHTVIASAEYDFLRVSSDYFAALLLQNGVDVTNMHYQGCDHGFLDCLGIVPQAEEVALSIAEEAKKLG